MNWTARSRSPRCGLFRKYSVMNVAGTLVPRHVLFSDKWATKKPDIVNEQTVAEEVDFVKNFPHAEQVRNIFALAGLDYGRMDYCVKQGRIQVWEINTNPRIVPPRNEVNAARLPTQSESARRIVEAMLALSAKNGNAHPFRNASFLGVKMTQLARRVRGSNRA
jgi:hypothetical protein